MKNHVIILYSYLWFVFANLLDILSSVGNLEGNPLMRRDGSFFFDPYKAVRIKLIFLLYYLILSIYAYTLGKCLSTRLAIYLAAIIPIWSTYSLVEVAFRNIL